MIDLMKERRWRVRNQGKKPYMSFDAGGKPNDPDTWLTYEEAETFRKCPDIFITRCLYQHRNVVATQY